MNKHFTALVALVMMLVGCANLSTQREFKMIESRLAEYVAAEFYIDIDLIDKSGLTDEQIRQKEIQAMQLSESICVLPYLTKVKSVIAPGFIASQTLATAIPAVDSEFEACIRPFGVNGHIGKTVGGTDLAMLYYLQGGFAAAREYQRLSNQLAIEESANGMALAYAFSGLSYPVNPNLTYVSPYVRSNGSVVRGHLRTAPNLTCIDNLSRCR